MTLEISEVVENISARFKREYPLVEVVPDPDGTMWAQPSFKMWYEKTNVRPDYAAEAIIRETIQLTETGTYETIQYRDRFVSFTVITDYHESVTRLTLAYGIKARKKSHVEQGRKQLEYLSRRAHACPVITSLLLRHEPWQPEKPMPSRWSRNKILYSKTIALPDASELEAFITAHVQRVAGSPKHLRDTLSTEP